MVKELRVKATIKEIWKNINDLIGREKCHSGHIQGNTIKDNVIIFIIANFFLSLDGVEIK